MVTVRNSLACITLGCSVLASCSVGENKQKLESCVDRFHAQLDSEQYDAIYTESASAVQNATTKEDFVKLLGTVHRKLGTVNSSKMVGWNLFFATGSGTVGAATYTTDFTQGTATEAFRMSLDDQGCRIVAYNISSKELLK
jgi:hypothetical protein